MYRVYVCSMSEISRTPCAVVVYKRVLQRKEGRKE